MRYVLCRLKGLCVYYVLCCLKGLCVCHVFCCLKGLCICYVLCCLKGLCICYVLCYLKGLCVCFVLGCLKGLSRSYKHISCVYTITHMRTYMRTTHMHYRVRIVAKVVENMITSQWCFESVHMLTLGVFPHGSLHQPYVVDVYCAATSCNTLQHTATHCNTAIRCRYIFCFWMFPNGLSLSHTLQIYRCTLCIFLFFRQCFDQLHNWCISLCLALF